jgi:hypothetical protein
MKKIPCIDCIVFPVCRNKHGLIICQNTDDTNCFKILMVSRLMRKCPELKSWYDYHNRKGHKLKDIQEIIKKQFSAEHIGWL